MQFNNDLCELYARIQLFLEHVSDARELVFRTGVVDRDYIPDRCTCSLQCRVFAEKEFEFVPARSEDKIDIMAKVRKLVDFMAPLARSNDECVFVILLMYDGTVNRCVRFQFIDKVLKQ